MYNPYTNSYANYAATTSPFGTFYNVNATRGYGYPYPVNNYNPYAYSNPYATNAYNPYNYNFNNAYTSYNPYNYYNPYTTYNPYANYNPYAYYNPYANYNPYAYTSPYSTLYNGVTPALYSSPTLGTVSNSYSPY